MSTRLAAIAARTVGRRVELARHVLPWSLGATSGTVTRVTAGGMTVATEPPPGVEQVAVRNLTADDIERWLD